MSKPDAIGAKSLEEILASIRKSLTGEGSDASSGPRGAARMPAPAAPETGTVADTAGDGDGDGQLSARLAGALNGPTNGAALDDDFAELLVPDDGKPAPSAPAGTDKPADARSEGKDPLWFLRRPSGAAESNGAQAPAAPTQPGEGAVPSTAAPVEEVKLSRPEILRASLPPLFGAEANHSPAARMAPPDAPKSPPSVAPAARTQAAPPAPSAAGKAAPGSLLTARTQPLLPPVQPAEETAEVVAAVETQAPPAPVAPEPTQFGEAAVASVTEVVPEPGQLPPADAKAADGLLGEAQAATEAEAKTAPTLLREPSATKPAPTPEAPQARTLEHVIGELLEPVIRQWLEANLPRLVEEVVRAEVARAIAAERSAPKV